MQTSRRNFLKKAGIGSAALASIPSIVNSCVAPQNKDNEDESTGIFSANDVVLFQGDSISDAGRDRKNSDPNSSKALGVGYAFLATANLLNTHADKNLTIYNRGISGNKVYQLAERWQADCLDLKPNLLSILIGVNDYWHFRNGNYNGTPEIYENDFRKLLEETKSKIPGIKLVICEPFILTGTRSVDESWVEPFKQFQEIAAKISKEFETIWVPFQKVFTEASKVAPATYWTPDGVHPSIAGAQLMAEAWLKSI